MKVLSTGPECAAPRPLGGTLPTEMPNAESTRVSCVTLTRQWLNYSSTNI